MRPGRSRPRRFVLTLAIACVAALAGTTTVFASALAAGSVMEEPDSPLFGNAACAPLVQPTDLFFDTAS